MARISLTEFIVEKCRKNEDSRRWSGEEKSRKRKSIAKGTYEKKKQILSMFIRLIFAM